MPLSLARAAIWAASMSSVLTSPPSSSSASSSGDSTCLSFAAASPVCEECASSAITANRLALGGRELADLLQREGEGLDGADDDLLARRQRLRELPALAGALGLDGGDHAGGALEVEQRVLKLGIDHVAVGDDDDGGEQLLVLGVVQVGEEMRGPCNRVGLARACRVLDEELAARALLQHLGLQLPGGVELVIAREDDAR